MKAPSAAARLEKIEQLEALRNKMIQTANTFGIQHPMVLKYSKKIDETHNKIMELQNSEK
ncbi:aspartyl-phosphate phosphatase Spo0E family protein [Fictibacillus phosphorivorans]|uniref:aspartyl-phosphate phosphatase Spo0E family protein n=1 Tax=Fictibacillus phosphorivorans TaxID=1221500 RepID=UPI00204094CE|nr:aspartyl-phosphate phosphatase Spo0E family protein [Fictibacillus phosphorivorans]MCM3718763.1 aspartyl-phosphate phosphatase Spo0E family protein [Fictibacillus phosphorivorans]MCM3776386.1 aspartyl-phosphate phosphatase Spo0E family protein [Fictibacillus phosphorivorans]